MAVEMKEEVSNIPDSNIPDVKVAGSGGHAPPPQTLPTWRLFLIITCMCIGLFMSLMDLSIISTALYTIALEFNDYRLTIWAALSYTLADIGSVVFFTRLSDVFGRKVTILTSFFMFTCFSMACGWAQTVEQLVLFRTLQGVGGAGLYSLTMVVCPELSPPKFMPIVVSMLGCSIAISGVCGPVLGGVITGNTTWRWIFWINVPIGVVAMVLLFFAWPSTKTKNIKDVIDSAKFKHLDFMGASLMAFGSVLFVICLQTVGTREFQWSSPAVVAMLTVALMSWILLFTWEWFLGRERCFTWMVPHLPFRLLTHRVMAAAFISTILTGFVQFLCIFSIPLRSQIVDLKTPVHAGIGLLPIVVSSAIGSMVGGGASAVKNVTFWTLTLGTALMIIGSGLMTTLPGNGNLDKAQYGYQVLIGFGLGMTVSTVTFMTSMEVEFRDHAVAQGTVAQFRILGGSISIAVSTIIMNNHLQSALTSDPALKLPPIALSVLYQAPFRILEYGSLAAIDFRESYIAAFKEDMQVCMWISIAAFVAALATWHANAPTVESRSLELEVAVRAYNDARDSAGREEEEEIARRAAMVLCI